MSDSKDERGIWRLGSRRSDLALWQTRHVRDLLIEQWPEIQIEIETYSTKGDQQIDKPLPVIGGKGVFTEELEKALVQHRIDAAVHSLKDLPVEPPDGLTIGAVPRRENPADILVSRKGYTLESLPQGATIGTSSRRRAAELRFFRQDLKTQDIRGNVPTRIEKALDENGPYDAIVLAYAGLARLSKLDVASQVLPAGVFLPAPGQGALGIQCRNEAESLSVLGPLNHYSSQMAVEAERSFLAGLGGGCALPIAAYAQVDNGKLTLDGRVTSANGTREIATSAQGSASEAKQIGEALAQEALDRGAFELLGLSE